MKALEDHIEIVDYDPGWPAGFAREAADVRRALGPLAGEFEHIGSTAVPGLGAKPTIDLMIGYPELEIGEGFVGAMKRLGYDYLGEYGIPGRHFFRKGLPPTHHVHCVLRDGDFWTKQIVFRDYLRSNPAVAVSYERLKRDLGTRFSHDRKSYTTAKTDFILDAQERAWRWAGAALIVFDLEATCWEGCRPDEKMETIEIGAVRLEADLSVPSEFDLLVKPKAEPALTDFCRKLTGIRQPDVDAAAPFPRALDDFSAWIGGRPFRLASWSGYDVAQLRWDCARHGRALPAKLERHIDLQALYARRRKSAPVSMAEALEREGLALQGRLHGALDDARNIARLAKLLLEEIG